MAFVQADLDKIDALIAGGVRKITFEDGRTMERQPLDQMLAARRVIAAQIQMASEAASGVVRRRFASFSRGL